MTAVIEYTTTGRGAWPSSGAGGTLRSNGAEPGRYYRSPISPFGLPKIGLIGYRANRDNKAVSINDYATWRAVIAVQNQLGLFPDGIWGVKTDEALREWQTKQGLVADGVFGSRSAKRMFSRLVTATGAAGLLTLGHIGYESSWDPGAVGGVSPRDLGLGQINGPAHPEMGEAARFDPTVAVPYVQNIVKRNLAAFERETDAIAAYNLGLTGCRDWIAAGRPALFRGRDVNQYINRVLSYATPAV